MLHRKRCKDAKTKKMAADYWVKLEQFRGTLLPTKEKSIFADEKRLREEISETYAALCFQEAAPSNLQLQSVTRLLNKLSEADQKKAIHHKIGKIYFEKFTPEEREEKIFEIIHHLNYGSSLLETEPEKLALIKLNLHTGKRAKLSSAYEAALAYFEQGILLLKELKESEENVKLSLALNSEACETSWLIGSIDKMNFFANQALSISESPLPVETLYVIKTL